MTGALTGLRAVVLDRDGSAGLAVRLMAQQGAEVIDRVVRDEDELARIRDYIVANPANWALDHQNPNVPSDTQPAPWELPAFGADGGKPHPYAGGPPTDRNS